MIAALIVALIAYSIGVTFAACHLACCASRHQRATEWSASEARTWHDRWSRSANLWSNTADTLPGDPLDLTDDQVWRLLDDIFAPVRPSPASFSTVDELMPRIVEGE